MDGNQCWRVGFVLVAAAMVAGCPPASKRDGVMPAWMAGSWRQSSGEGLDGAWTEEFWTAPRAGQMMGASRSGTGGALASWEHMRLVREPDGAVTFYAMPEGTRASAFPMVARTATSIAFANPAHDYPQRIRYWREGRTLNAEIARIDGSKAVRWKFAPVAR